MIANTTHYAALLSGQPQRIGSRLAAIGPRLGNLALQLSAEKKHFDNEANGATTSRYSGRSMALGSPVSVRARWPSSTLAAPTNSATKRVAGWL